MRKQDFGDLVESVRQAGRIHRGEMEASKLYVKCVTMPLYDHFNPPLSQRRQWDSFHGAWAEAIAALLNQHLLPERYFAEARVNLATSVEIDVAGFEEAGHGTAADDAGDVAVWAPPRPRVRAPVDFTHADLFEVKVLCDEEGPQVVAAVELVSPANKDRPANRKQFAIKCASYLQDGIGLIVADVVTAWRGNLHRELLQLLKVKATTPGQKTGELYAAAYRQVADGEALAVEVWSERLAVGQGLPTLPLWIGPDLCVPVDLEETYRAACAARRI